MSSIRRAEARAVSLARMADLLDVGAVRKRKSNLAARWGAYKHSLEMWDALIEDYGSGPHVEQYSECRNQSCARTYPHSHRIHHSARATNLLRITNFAFAESLRVGELKDESNAMPTSRRGRVVLTKAGENLLNKEKALLRKGAGSPSTLLTRKRTYRTKTDGRGAIVVSVRSEAVHIYKGKDRTRRCKLVARLCHSCGQFMPASRFSKNGKPAGRSICKPCDNRRRRPLTISEVRNPVDKAYAIRAERALPLRTLKVRTRVLLNWCPDCKDYRHENHSQPCREVTAMAMAAD